jgi:hypothetical protein
MAAVFGPKLPSVSRFSAAPQLSLFCHSCIAQQFLRVKDHSTLRKDN